MKLLRISFILLTIAHLSCSIARAQDPLPSWNDGPSKQAIVDFVHATTETGGAKFVPPEQRIATFDQDGTLWVEHPLYTQVIYCLDRVAALVAQKPGSGTSNTSFYKPPRDEQFNTARDR
jgi:hypothetical protein